MASFFEHVNDAVDAVLLVFIEIGPPSAELVGEFDGPVHYLYVILLRRNPMATSPGREREEP